MNLLTRIKKDRKVQAESHYERLQRLAIEADERKGVDVTELSAADLIAIARRA